jgi:ubiquinone/menaquinone biosynthesis C-methylase UbiE
MSTGKTGPGRSERRAKPRRPRSSSRTSWDHLAGWYDGWVGSEGSEHHRALAMPAALDLLDLKRGESLLDIGCGQGAFASSVTALGASYTGVDVSGRMLERARKRWPKGPTFVEADATRLEDSVIIEPRSFDAVVFLLSIQNMDPLQLVIRGATRAINPSGRLVVVMTHPCFGVPRQSGWGWDANRKLNYRRVDSYLKPLAVPLKPLSGRAPVISFHRPLQEYFTAFAEHGLVVDALREVATSGSTRVLTRAARNPDIPTFLALRARLAPGRP